MDRKERIIRLLSQPAAQLVEGDYVQEEGIGRLSSDGHILDRIYDDDLQTVCSHSYTINQLRLCLKITDLGMRHFPKGDWKNLTILSVLHAPIGDKACKYITKCNMPSLKYLGLPSTNVGDAGVLHLCKGKWENLQSIVLIGTRVREMGTKQINKGKWPKLERIFMEFSGIYSGNKNLKVDQCIDIILSDFQVLKQFKINDLKGSKLDLALRNKFVKYETDD